MSWLISQETTTQHTENVRSGQTQNNTSRNANTSALPETTVQVNAGTTTNGTQTEGGKLISTTENHSPSEITTTQTKPQNTAATTRVDPASVAVTQQVQAALTETNATNDAVVTASTKRTDAGFAITFSIPIRGGLYNDGSANPPL